jgi:DNA-binding HxlR family transcriptional regulator
MPGKTDLSKLNCSLARTLEVVGDWWTLLIIRDAFLGVRRFGDFQRSLGIAKNILAKRLERLAVNGILKRGGSEKRPVYQLTERGQALLPAMIGLMQWGDAWLSAERPPVLVTDEKGRQVSPLRLKSGCDEVSAKTVRFHPGPGATARTRAFFSELSRSSDASDAADSATIKGASRRRPRQGR